MKQAQYQISGNNECKCTLCPHFCVLTNNKAGICRTRICIKGTIYVKNYGELCSLAIDPVEKKPLFHFLPGTKTLSLASEGCNFRCLNCQNYSISQVGQGSAGGIYQNPESIVNLAIEKQCESISYTYSEPVVFYEYMYETAKIAHSRGLKNIMVSNGYINPEPLYALCEFLDAANIDLKCSDDKTYKKLTGGSLQPVLKTLETLKQRGVWLEITNLLVTGITDKKELLESLCLWLEKNNFHNSPVHFSRFYPTFRLSETPPTPLISLKTAIKTARSHNLKFIYSGNFHGLDENTYCPQCGGVLIERNGYKIRNTGLKGSCCGKCGVSIPGVWE